MPSEGEAITRTEDDSVASLLVCGERLQGRVRDSVKGAADS